MAVQNNDTTTKGNKKTAAAWVNVPITLVDKDGNEFSLGRASLPLYNDTPLHAAVIAKYGEQPEAIKLSLEWDLNIVETKALPNL